MAKQRIGILGGSFDPIHRGHINMALSVLDSCSLDQVLVMPAGLPPHKKCVASAEDRWRMAVAACSCDSRLVPSDLELNRSGPVYTIDTLRCIRSSSPESELFCIIGADALMNLGHWYRRDEIFSLCSFLVVPRPDAVGYAELEAETGRLSSLGGRFMFVRHEPVAVSSSAVRSSFAEGLEPPGLSVAVLEYCSCMGLYGAGVRVPQAARWIRSLFTDLNPRRFAHSLSVAYTARRLALKHGIDPVRAEQAGILHDCAKCLPLDEMRKIAKKHSLTADPEILSSGALLHSIVGARVARDQYGMNDPAVLEAIAYHNTGCPGMSRLAMCVCLADSVEPLRKSYPLLDRVRALSESSLEEALLLSLEGTAEYVRSGGKHLHPRTSETISWLRSVVPSAGAAT